VKILKLQVIKRNGRFYFHVYLPKNIIEHILRWERGEELNFQVIDDCLIIRKSNTPNFKHSDWSKALECDFCNRKTIFIKGVIKKNQLIIISRCVKCKKRKKIILPLSEKNNWLGHVEEMIERCDLCGEKSLETIRARFGWDWKAINYATIVYLCKNCKTERTKIIPYDILSDIRGILPKKVELPKIKCVYCGYEINNYDENTCPNCHKEIICKKCGNFILEKSRYCVHCGEEIEEFSNISQLETQHCPFCNEIINQGALFCDRCGNLVSCFVCGAPLREISNYCGNCGANIKKGIDLISLMDRE